MTNSENEIIVKVTTQEELDALKDKDGNIILKRKLLFIGEELGLELQLDISNIGLLNFKQADNVNFIGNGATEIRDKSSDIFIGFGGGLWNVSNPLFGIKDLLHFVTDYRH